MVEGLAGWCDTAPMKEQAYLLDSKCFLKKNSCLKPWFYCPSFLLFLLKPLSNFTHVPFSQYLSQQNQLQWLGFVTEMLAQGDVHYFPTSHSVHKAGLMLQVFTELTLTAWNGTFLKVPVICSTPSICGHSLQHNLVWQ